VLEHGRNLQDEIHDAHVGLHVVREHFVPDDGLDVENDHHVKAQDETLVVVNVRFRDKSFPKDGKRERWSCAGDVEIVGRDDDHVVVAVAGDGAVGSVVVAGDDDAGGAVGDVNVGSVDVAADNHGIVGKDWVGTAAASAAPVDVGEIGHRKAVESTGPGTPAVDDELDAMEASPKYSSTAAPRMPYPQMEVGYAEVVPRLDSK